LRYGLITEASHVISIRCRNQGAKSGYAITFVDIDRSLVRQLRSNGSYNVRLLGNPEGDVMISGFAAYHTSESDTVAQTVGQADAVFTVVGGSSLPHVAPSLAAGIRWRMSENPTPELNIIVCENYFRPAALLREALYELLTPYEREYLESRVGIAEAQVLRSCMAQPEPNDPLALRVQDYWRLPVNVEALRGPLPPIVGLQPTESDSDGLMLKLYTYNSISAAIAYLGYQAGYALLADAANDPKIAVVAEGVGDEASRALTREFGIELDKLKQLVSAALSKFRNPAITDPIARNARDLIRKLSRHDRLVGPAALAVMNGVQPVHLVTAIVAALRYDEPTDTSAMELQRRLSCEGLPAVLRDVCGLEPYSPLVRLIADAYHLDQKRTSCEDR
jgi:mannitol-1-phosphate 5-dehydrogenase